MRKLTLALLLAVVALPAAAATVPYKTPIKFAWTGSTGPVTGYLVYVLQPGSTVPVLSHQVTIPEASFNVAPATGASLIVQVVPVDAAGTTGPASLASQELVVLAQGGVPPDQPLVTALGGRLCLKAPTVDALGNPIDDGAPNAILDCTLATRDGLGHADQVVAGYDAGETRCYDHTDYRGPGSATGSCRSALGASALVTVAVTFPTAVVYGPPGAPSIGLPVP